MSNAEDLTPYSTVAPLFEVTGFPDWVGEDDVDRIAAYQAFEDMYWSQSATFRALTRGDDDYPIYIPVPRTIVDTTAHYFMKGLMLTLPGNEDPDKPIAFDPANPPTDFPSFFKAFMKREKFYSKFHVAKHSGVLRGDFLFHITADDTKPTGSKISITSLDPAGYIVITDPDDVDKIMQIRLFEQMVDPEDETKTLVKVLDYWYEGEENSEGTGRLVFREEALWEMEGWNNPEKATKVKQILAKERLDPLITHIPVYHFKNMDWQGDPFGRSELLGYERIIAAINQGASDEELSLALMGLGVYATDAGRPIGDRGQEVDWEIAPGQVLEVPGATMFKRLEGIGSVTPMQDHLAYLEKSLYESSGTSDIARGQVDVQVAESGIALAIRFLPTAAKLEQRDMSGVDVLSNMMYDWARWLKVYEGIDGLNQEILPVLGDKLPVNRAKKVEELNNMFDRNVISAEYYRQEMKKLGYEFPKDIAQQILDEKKAAAEAMTIQSTGDGGDNPSDPANPKGENPSRKTGEPPTTLPKSNGSNNKARPNESGGTEIGASK